MADTVYVVPADRQRDLERYLQRLPDILSGREQDRYGIVKGIHARMAFTLYAFIMDAFEAKGRGEADEAGERWAPLSPEYLAYKRPVIGRSPPKAGGLSPGGKDGYMTPDQLKKWQRIYAATLKALMNVYPIEEAKPIAAAHAWKVLKGPPDNVQTKLGTFGARQAGVDYQTLVDTGNLRHSLQVGKLVDGDYTPKNDDQIYESDAGSFTIGSRDRTAAFHHNGKGRRKRRLWPEHFPASWWHEMVGQARAGVMHFVDFFGRRA